MLIIFPISIFFSSIWFLVKKVCPSKKDVNKCEERGNYMLEDGKMGLMIYLLVGPITIFNMKDNSEIFIDIKQSSSTSCKGKGK